MPDEMRETGVSPSELRKQIVEAREQASKLETELCALEELRDDLVIHERDAERSASLAQEELDRLTANLEAKRRRGDEIEAEMQEVQLEISALERQCEVRDRRHAALSREAGALEHELQAGRRESISMDSELRDIHESLRSMDRRIEFAHRKAANTPADRTRR